MNVRMNRECVDVNVDCDCDDDGAAVQGVTVKKFMISFIGEVPAGNSMIELWEMNSIEMMMSMKS